MKKAFRKNEIYTVRVEDLTDLGFGVAHIEGAAVFIAGAVMGDLVRVRLIKVNSSYLVARVEEFLEYSPERYSRCPESCTACAYRNITYSRECELKEEGVRRLFSSEAQGGIRVAPITPSPSETRYRNKAQYPVVKKDGKFSVGFYAPKSHRVMPIEDCPLTPSVFSKICDKLCNIFTRLGLSAYNEETGEGLIRHIYLRRGEVSGEILLTLVVTSLDFSEAESIVRDIISAFPNIVGILLNENCEETNVVLGDKWRTLVGRDYIFDTLAGVKLKLAAPAFYQVNHGAAELLYRKARELAELRPTDTLLDIYCGAGSIGLSMAKDVTELIGIEIVPSAVECAKENAAASGIDNARFYVGDAKGTEHLLNFAERDLGHKLSPDVIILDPPRAGCAEELISLCATLNPRKIVYISCNPKTLARDLLIFKQFGYSADTVYPFDLFPMTGHVESLVCLQRQKNFAIL